MRKTLFAAAILGSLASAVPAQDGTWSETRFHRVHLRNGNFIDGRLVQDTNAMVVLKLPSGEFGIRKDQVARDHDGRLRVEFVKMRTFHEAPRIVKVKAADPAAAAEAPSEAEALKKKAKRASDDPLVAPPTGTKGEQMVQLLERLKAAPPEKKSPLAQSIMAFGKEGAVFLAGSLVSLDDAGVASAAFALGQAKEPETLPVLRGLVDHRSPTVRSCVAEALGVMGDSSDLIRLRSMVKDPDAWVRASVISTLGRVKDRDSFGPIGRALLDADAFVRKQAMEALTSLSGQFDLKDDYRRALSDALESSSGAVKADLIRGAGASRDKGMSRPLIRLLTDDDPLIRAHTITALCDLDAKDATDQIVHLFTTERDYWPRVQLAAAADKMRLTVAIEHLIGWLLDRDQNIQLAASRALRSLTGQNLGVNAVAWADWWSKSKR